MTNGQQTFIESDPRSLIAQADDDRHRMAWLEKRKQELLSSTAGIPKSSEATNQEISVVHLMMYVLVILVFMSALMFVVAYGIIHYLDNDAK